MQFEIILIAIIVSLACALCGVFLVLRKMSLISDSISHSIILGIILGFFISKSLTSPLPLIGAVLAGLASVIFTELLQKTQLVKSDAAIGLVFPALFSGGVLLVTLYAGNVHIDVDSVLLGEIGLAPLDRISLLGLSLPKSLVSMGIIFILDLLCLLLFFKELKLTTFDKGLAISLGFSPTKINYGLMLMVSITCVGAFDSVGSVLVIALMIAPAAAALLITDILALVIVSAGIIASLSAISGYYLAIKIDASISGAMATMTGIFFLLVYLFSPKNGIFRKWIMAKKLKIDFAVTILAMHLSSHQGTEKEKIECREKHLTEHINWTERKAKKIVAIAEKREIIKRDNGQLFLLPNGKALVKMAIDRL